jgi:hypothetical protein
MIFGGEIMLQLRVWKGMHRTSALIFLPPSPTRLSLAPPWKVFLSNEVFFPKTIGQMPSSPQDF